MNIIANEIGSEVRGLRFSVRPGQRPECGGWFSGRPSAGTHGEQGIAAHSGLFSSDRSCGPSSALGVELRLWYWLSGPETWTSLQAPFIALDLLCATTQVHVRRGLTLETRGPTRPCEGRPPFSFCSGFSGPSPSRQS